MAARRVSESRFRRLVRAKVIDPEAFPRRQDGNLTRPAARRVERIWDRVGGLIANPSFRPFHTYVPRKEGNLRRAAKVTGIPVASLKGVKGIPIPVPAGSKIERIRLTKDGFSLRFSPGDMLRRFVFVPANRLALVEDPEAYGDSIVRRFPGDLVTFRVRTGAGFVIPEEHAETLGQTFLRLVSSYNNAFDFIMGTEVIELGDA